MLGLSKFLLFSVLISALVWQEGGCGAVYYRFALGSCYNNQLESDSTDLVWKVIRSYAPNHLSLLGDQIYVDKVRGGGASIPQIIATEYDKLANNSHFKELIQSLDGWTATFDDHDYGADAADKTFKYRNFSQDAFWKFAASSQSYQRMHSDGKSRRSGVYSSTTGRITVGDGQSLVYKLILLDVRSNKDPAGTANGDFLGAEQWEWLKRELYLDSAEAAHGPLPDLVMLGSGIQILPSERLTTESWSDFEGARDRLLKFVALSNSFTNVILLSGDIHAAEVSKATTTLTFSEGSGSNPTVVAKAELVELTSSGLTHTFTKVLLGPPTPSSSHNTSLSSELESGLRVESRSVLKTVLYYIYRRCWPNNFLERGKDDHYALPHFALLDVAEETAGNGSCVEGAQVGGGEVETDAETAGIALLFSVVDVATGEIAMAVRIPFRSRDKLRKAGKDDHWLDADDARLSIATEPWLGKPSWNQFLFGRAVIAGLLLVFIVLPCSVFMWFLFASIWYIFIGIFLVWLTTIKHKR